MGLFSKIKNWWGSSEKPDTKPDTKLAVIDSAWAHVENIGANGDVYEHMDRSNNVTILVTDNKMKGFHKYRLEVHIQAFKVR